MHRAFSKRCVTSASLLASYGREKVNHCAEQRRSVHHNYMNNGQIADHHGIDMGSDRLNAQQAMNDLEQWEGYSDSYLAKTPNYNARVEQTVLPWSRDTFDVVLELCYRVYGEAADRLQLLHADPLHQDFHKLLEEAKHHREELAAEIDKIYPSAHPTVKTQIDAYGVRRYYFLKDWEVAVENKRKEILEKLSPEFIEESIKGKNLAESYKAHLKSLGNFIESTTALPAHVDESKYNEEELVLIRQKETYYRKLRHFGRMQSDCNENLR